jgi:hypothetical protein
MRKVAFPAILIETVRVVLVPFSGLFDSVKFDSRATNPGITETAKDAGPDP